MNGEDIRCLQQFLNQSGFQIADSGPGSPGNETSLFRTLTKAAVVKWQQESDVSPASGVFGPVSQAAYLLTLIDNLEAAAADQSVATKPTPKPEVAGAATSAEGEDYKAAAKVLEKALRVVRDTEEKIEDFAGSKDEKSDLEADLRGVRYDLYDALQSFFAADYKAVKNQAEDIMQDADAVLKSVSGKSDQRTAKKAVSAAQDEYDEAADVIADTSAKRKDIKQAEDLMSDARVKTRRAEAAYDDADWEAAIDFSQEANRLVNKALSAVGAASSGNKNQAEDEIDDVWDDYLDALDKVERAEAKDKKSYKRAWSFLDEAKDLIKDADDAVADKDWTEAVELAEDAQAAIADALDEL